MDAREVDAAVAAILGGARARTLESETLDFKTDTRRSRDDTLRDLAEACACMANAGGGAVVVGVADSTAGAAAFVGSAMDPVLVRRRVFELTDPHLVVSVQERSVEGSRLLVLAAPSSADVHAVGGRCSERIGTSCEPMSPQRIGSVLGDRRMDDWSAHDSGLGLGAVVPAAMDAARRMLERAVDPARQGFARLPGPDLLRRLGVVTERETLTNGGALLFAELGDDDRIAYSFRRSPSGALMANERLGAPVVVALDRVFELVDARTDRTPVSLGRGQQFLFADLPEAAVREAIGNAVMHRDYRLPGPVVVEHAPTRFSVTSPGSFVSGVTPANVLTTSSVTRNPRLATAIRGLGLAETAGTGVDRMYAEMTRLGHQPPAYEADPSRVRVTLLGGAPNTYLTRFTSSLPREEADDADTMLVLLTLLGRRTVGAEVMGPLLQRSEAEAQAVLERLCVQPVALLESTRHTAEHARPLYRLRGEVIAALGPAVAYNRRGPDEYDRKVVGLVREAGRINSRMVRLLLDLEVTPASRVLADLVERGILVKTSAAQRGPGVTYGPGPQFPRGKRTSSASGEPEL